MEKVVLKRMTELISLNDKYLATSFWVELETCALRLRVGEPNPLLYDLLTKHQTDSWAYVTASNPGSRLLTREENERRNRELQSHVDKLGYPMIFGRGIGHDTQWPAEESILILGINRTESLLLGANFGQNAILLGEKDGTPELCSCDGMNNPSIWSELIDDVSNL